MQMISPANSTDSISLLEEIQANNTQITKTKRLNLTLWLIAIACLDVTFNKTSSPIQNETK